MLLNMGLAGGLILFALLGWVRIQQLARDFAARHPEFGPAKEEGGGCGSGSCAGGCHGDHAGSAGQCLSKPNIMLDTNLQELDR